MNNWLLNLVLESIAEEIEGKRIAACRFLRPIFSLELGGSKASEGEKLFLTAILAPPGPFLFLARRDPFSGYGVSQVARGITGWLVKSIAQYEGQRIALLHLENRGSKAKIYIRLFGRTGGVRLEQEGKITWDMAAKTTEQSAWGSRNARSFATISQAELKTSLEKQNPVEGLDVPLIAHFNEIDPGKTARNLIRFRDSVRREGTPFTIINAYKPAKAYPFPISALAIQNADGLAGPFTSSMEAGCYVGQRALKTAILAVISSEIKPVKRMQRNRRELLEKLEKSYDEAKNYATTRKEAETLAAFQKRVKPGIESVKLPDPYNEDSSIVIKLDPSRSIQEEIERRFKRAAKMKRSLPALEKRKQEVKKELRDLTSIIEEITGGEDLKSAFTTLDRAFKRWRIESKGKTKRKGAKGKNYRRFDLDGNWFVLVGRSNRENDEITFSIASPGDIWMHAQGVPGSHLLLKSKGNQDNPPASIIESAAGIAAFYSKAKHSSIVPVIYTRRKYVRKPRKAPPGQVLCSHEKTIFATPSIPPQSKNSKKKRGS